MKTKMHKIHLKLNTSKPIVYKPFPLTLPTLPKLPPKFPEINTKDNFNPYINYNPTRPSPDPILANKSVSLLSLSQISSPDSLESTSKKNQRTSSDSDNVLKYTFKTKVLETTNRSLLMKIRQKQSVSKQIQQLNSELSPRFRLSKLDLEDIENSRVLRPGEWGAKLSVQLMRNINPKRGLRRKNGGNSIIRIE